MSRPVLSVVEREEILVRRGRGEPLPVIGRAMGRDAKTVGGVIRAAGGCRPAAARRSVRVLSAAEREKISRGLAARESFRLIAERLGRAHTSVSREVERNGERDGYRAGSAERAAWRRARRPKPMKLALNPTLRAVVRERLMLCWSPQQIVGWLRREYPDDVSMRISHETIYTSLFIQARGELRRELTRYLRTARAIRKPRVRRISQGQGQIQDAISIRERPAEATDRAVPGHWEGDLVMGKHPSGIATLVERTSRFVILIGLPDGHSAETVRTALAERIQTLPERLRRSLTWDRGHEMAEHLQFTIDTNGLFPSEWGARVGRPGRVRGIRALSALRETE